MDMNRANEARDMTKRLSLLAEKYKCAILLIGHMNKAGGNKAAYRGCLLYTSLEDEIPSVDQLKAALRKATCECTAVPVTCGSAYRNKGDVYKRQA